MDSNAAKNSTNCKEKCYALHCTCIRSRSDITVRKEIELLYFEQKIILIIYKSTFFLNETFICVYEDSPIYSHYIPRYVEIPPS